MPGILSVHELYIWRLDQDRNVASARIVLDSRTSISEICDLTQKVHRYFCRLGVEMVTIQSEIFQLFDMSIEVTGMKGDRAGEVLGKRDIVIQEQSIE